MNAALRRRHRQLWSLLAIVLVAVGLLARRQASRAAGAADTGHRPRVSSGSPGGSRP